MRTFINIINIFGGNIAEKWALSIGFYANYSIFQWTTEYTYLLALWFICLTLQKKKKIIERNRPIYLWKEQNTNARLGSVLINLKITHEIVKLKKMIIAAGSLNCT